MRSNLVVNISLLLVAASLLLGLFHVGVAKGADQQHEQAADQQAVKQRGGFALPKLFDFVNFRRLFKKSYGSLVEELAREKLFLARAYRAFTSAVKYRFGLASKWLAVNHFSDWTPQELKRQNSRKGQLYSFRKDKPVSSHRTVVSDDEQVPVATREDIVRQLDEVEKNRDQPGFKELAEQLEESVEEGPARRKRDTVATRRRLTLQDLFHAPEEDAAESTKSARIASNNPDYQPPELESEGAADPADEESEPMATEQASLISQIPGAAFIGSVTQALTRRFAGTNKNVQKAAGDDDDDVEEDVQGEAPVEDDGLIIDHRKNGCFFKPRYQGDCGSCFIFSTIALYEWLHCRDTGHLVSFSEQYLIDCGAREGIKGCSGGFESVVGLFVGIYGLELRNNYPYRQKVGMCPYPEDADPKTMGYLKIKDQQGLHVTSFRLLEKSLRDGPILLGFAMFDEFHEYGGGVDNPATDLCDEHRGHSMVLVGMGREDGQDYWLFRNSFSTDWGEQGYYKLSKESDCLMDGIGWTSKAKFKWTDSIAKNPNYDGAPIQTSLKRHRKRN